MAAGNRITQLFPSGYNGASVAPGFAVITGPENDYIEALDFDASLSEAADWTWIVPDTYAGNGVVAQLYFVMTSASTGSLDIHLQAKAYVSGTNVLTNAYGAVVSVSVCVPTNGLALLVSANMSHAQLGSPTTGTIMRTRITRPSTANTGDARFFGGELIAG